jgi:hypothetical protein
MKKSDFKGIKELRYTKDFLTLSKTFIEELQFAGEICGDRLHEKNCVLAQVQEMV